MDISEIKQLTELFAALDIQSFKLTQGDFTVEMKKEKIYASDEAVATSAMKVGASTAPAPVVVVEPQEVAAPVEELRSIKSPLVGTFYASPSPDRPDFVSVGSKVKKGSVLCIVEAMKVMNEIHADADGEIAEVCATDGELVEFGTPLFKLR